MRISRTEVIDSTKGKLWPFITDPELIKLWNTDIIRDEILTPGPAGVGTKTRLLIREGSKEVEYDNEIMVYDEPDTLEIRLTGGSLGAGPMTVRYRVTGEGGALAVAFESEWQPHGFMLKLMTPLITIVGRKNAKNVMARLKDVVESAVR